MSGTHSPDKSTVPDRDRLAADIDQHWLFRTNDGVFRCSADDWQHGPDDTIAEGDRFAPFSAHIADSLIALGWTRLEPIGPCCVCGTPPVGLFPLCGGHAPAVDGRTLDEERLARALRPWEGKGYFVGTADVTFIVGADHDPTVEFAAAIAKAYREDEEDA